MEGMEYWIASVSDANGLYGSELIWGDGMDREDAWARVSGNNAIRCESRRMGIPVRLDGPFSIPRADAPAIGPDGVRDVISDLIDEAANTSAWDDALAGEDEAMLSAVTAACKLIGEPVPGSRY